MTLYLSSDEQTLDESNTRTKFKNRILPDFFENDSFNLKLHEFFFDSNYFVTYEYKVLGGRICKIQAINTLQTFPHQYRTC